MYRDRRADGCGHEDGSQQQSHPIVRLGPAAGNLVAVERAGVENKEFGSYLFGEIDVPALEDPSNPMAPYDSSRSLQLNLEHPVAGVLIGFIGSKLEHVRASLSRKAKEARKSEEARRLEAQAQQIATVLNADFSSIRDRLQTIKSVTAKPGPAGARVGTSGSGVSEPDMWVSGTQDRGTIERAPREPNKGAGRGRPAPEVHVTGQLTFIRPAFGPSTAPSVGSGFGLELSS